MGLIASICKFENLCLKNSLGPFALFWCTPAIIYSKEIVEHVRLIELVRSKHSSLLYYSIKGKENFEMDLTASFCQFVNQFLKKMFWSDCAILMCACNHPQYFISFMIIMKLMSLLGWKDVPGSLAYFSLFLPKSTSERKDIFIINTSVCQFVNQFFKKCAGLLVLFWCMAEIMDSNFSYLIMVWWPPLYLKSICSD